MLLTQIILFLLSFVFSTGSQPIPATIPIIGEVLVPRNFVATSIASMSGDWYQDLRGFDEAVTKYFWYQFNHAGIDYLKKFSSLQDKLSKLNGSSLCTAIANEARALKISF